MFLKKRHLEILKKMKETEMQNEIEKSYPEEFKTRALELFILGFVELEGNSIKFTEAGKKLINIIDELDLEKIPEVFVDSEIIKIMELLDETGKIPDEWMELLKERFLADENGLTSLGKNILSIYKETHPVVYLTPEILAFIRDMPKIGLYDELITYKNTKPYGENIVNALQAMRLLLISPKTESKAFSTTKAVSHVLKISSMVPKISRALILRKEDFEMLKRGETTEEMTESGFYEEGKVSELGKAMIDTYEDMGKIEDKTLPIYVLEDEIKVLKAIEDIKEKYETNPEIIPTYDEIKKRVDIEDLGAVLHTLESKELIKREVVKNKDTYWMTEFGEKVKDLGEVSTDGMKAITYPESGDVPIAEWVVSGKNEGTVKRGITEKGKYLIKMSKTIKRKPYLTKYDVSALVKIPRKEYIHRDELVGLIKDHVGGEEKEIIKALGEAESKGFIKELQNKMVKLTKLGEDVKESIEMAKVQELLSTKFAITPTTFNILKAIYDNREEFDKVWKEKSEGKEHKENEIILLAKLLPLTPEEIKKNLVILKNVGFIGKKGLTDSGVKLVEAYIRFHNEN
ncbi:protein of unknown function DUF505 [Methanocaldococcus vulcanius M7]|uniref:DUF505 domain-containing protein n=1 Tax=Methanocaldococcus vulcanius (strain ATCC 700851 / DSM 12094 / M7) TaxID=579137 RepID=C9RFC3_METVM|nr:DUF505 family protein [Methanocaldococcus vulcanius]ACX72275.1 protein of unknown function DUF505 [Methanocaldococcus vulcanius M7]